MLIDRTKRALATSMGRQLANQWAVLGEAGAFDAGVDVERLPVELASAADAVRLGQKAGREVEVRGGRAFGLVMGAFAAIAFVFSLLESGEPALGELGAPQLAVAGAFGLGVYFVAGKPFGRIMGRLNRYVVLPVPSETADVWRETVEHVGYRSSGSRDGALDFRPGLAQGKASGHVFLLPCEDGMAFVIGPARAMTKVVEHATSTHPPAPRR